MINGVKNYLSVSQFARAYGQTPANIAALTSYLAGFGIKTTVYADNVDVSATGTAGEFDAALSVTQNQYHVPAITGTGGLAGIPAQTVHGNAQSPLLPYRLSNFVLAILGLTNYGPYASHAVHVEHQRGSSRGGQLERLPRELTGLPDALQPPVGLRLQLRARRPVRQGRQRERQTLAIVTLAALDPGAPQYFWNNIAQSPNTGRTFTVQNIDGGPGAPSDASGTGETDLDLEQSGSLAPGANVIDYQAPNTDPGFADAFFTAASQNIADTVSTSWASPRPSSRRRSWPARRRRPTTAAFDEAFLELAAQGQSAFDAAGDAGAYNASRDLGTTNLSVDSNADSPYITATGGTTLPLTGTLTGPDGSATVTVPSERAWGWDYLWPAIAKTSGVP